MRIYDSCLEMHNEVARDLHEMGTHVHPETMQDKDVRDNDDYTTLELSPYDFAIIDPSDRNDLILKLGLNLQWCFNDFDERVSAEPINPGVAWTSRRETWEPFIHDGKFAYTYNERINMRVHNLEEVRGVPALDILIRELMKNPNTRQAVLPIFCAPYDLPHLGGVARVPCSLHYQFAIREGELRMFYVMRSSDFATHFAYDIWMATRLQLYVANQIGLKIGRFAFFTGSLHLYKKDWDKRVF